MNRPLSPEIPAGLSLELFQPHPDVLYSLDATARLAGIPRRSVLIYCRAGLVQPVFQPPHGVMAFTEEAVYTVRRIEDMRAVHGIGIPWIKAMLSLRKELEVLRAEVRFLRRH